MTIFDTIGLLVAFTVLVFPYAVAAWWLLGRCGVRGRALAPAVSVSVATGMLLAIPLLRLACSIGIDLYLALHPFLLAGGIIGFVFQLRGRRPGGHSFGMGFVLLAVGVFLSRWLPLLVGHESLGGGDARFHNILTAKLLFERSVAVNWAPFAPVPVAYPQGAHAMLGVLAEMAGRPVHQALNFMMLMGVVLTAGAIHALAHRVFRNRSKALVAMAAYAFLASWCSLDYPRWGGLPNLLGMLACVLVWVLFLADGRPARPWCWFGLVGWLALAIVVTHHYSLIVIVLVAGVVALAVPSRRLRLRIAGAACSAGLLSAPVLGWHYVKSMAGLGNTSVFVFREPFTGLETVVGGIGPGLLGVVALAVFLERHRIARSWRRQIVLAAVTALFGAFVGLEYGYRAAVIAYSGGKDAFTALTPDRMASDLVYPLSVLAGGVLTGAHGRRRQLTVLAVGLLSVASYGFHWPQLIESGRDPAAVEAAVFVRDKLPDNIFVVGAISHLEYIAWRQTSYPPLPASEQRNHPELLDRRRPRSLDEWSHFAQAAGRPFCIVFPRSEPAMAGLRTVFENATYSVRIPADQP